MLPIRFESLAILYILSKFGLDRIGQTATKEDLDFAIKPKQFNQQEQQQQNEIVIDKHTASIFIDTGFEHMLQSAGIITVMLVLLQNLELNLALGMLPVEAFILS